MNDPKQLSTILPMFFDVQKQWQMQLISHWPEIMGKISTKAIVEKIEDQTIVIAVNDSVWMQELYFLSDTIIHKINDFLQGNYICRIKFKKSGIKDRLKAKPIPKKNVNPILNHVLSAKEELCLSLVKDEDIKKYLKAYLNRCKS